MRMFLLLVISLNSCSWHPMIEEINILKKTKTNAICGEKEQILILFGLSCSSTINLYMRMKWLF